MSKIKTKLIDKFYGGITRDDKSRIVGAASNVEELDIWTNSDYFQAEQIFTADTMPAGTEIYAYDADDDDNEWGMGQETTGGKVRLVKVTSGGGTNPGSFSTVKTSADSTNLAYSVSPLKFFRRDDGDFLYFVTKDSSDNVILNSYNIATDTISTQDSAAVTMTLSNLNGSYDRISLKVFFGSLFVTNGQYMSKVDKDGAFYEDAFTLPNGWDAVDIIPVSDVSIILARSVNRNANNCNIFWWDLTSSLQVDDSLNIPHGGPQWIINHKETIKILTAQGGKMRMYQLTGAFPGAVPMEIPGIALDNLSTETTTQQISAPKTVDFKDNLLFFALWKTDKSGMYAMGQQDSDKPTALILSKRFHTTDYSSHTPIAFHTQGPNFYASFVDNGTHSHARCESQNSPSRSSNAVYESIILDEGDPVTDKDLKTVYLATQPLAASTSADLYISADYGAYSQVTRPGGSVFNTLSGLIGFFRPSKYQKVKSYKFKVELTSSTTNSPKIIAIGYKANIHDNPAEK